MNASEQNPRRPGWLDEDFLKVCIENDTGASLANIDIEDVKLYYVVPKGENFMSLILRVVVEGRTSPRNSLNKTTQFKYILKITNSNDMKDLLKHFITFDKEVKMFFKYVPAYEEVLSEVGIRTSFSCRGIHVLGAKEVIVLEDLGSLGYILSDRIAGNDWDHSRLVVSKMAMLHAASMRYFQKNTTAELADTYYISFIPENEDNPNFGRTTFAHMTALMKDALSQKSGYENEVDILSRMNDAAFDVISDSWRYKQGNIFNTLLHGDIWSNNIMFKYEENGKPSDVRLIDLQCSYYNSTAVEFLYYFFSSVSDDVRKNRFEDLVELHYETFVDTLERIGFEGPKPTLEQWKQEVKERANLFLYSCSFMLPYMKVAREKKNEDRSESETMSYEESKEMTAECHKNPAYVESLALTVDLLRAIGVFERLEKVLKDRNL